MWLSKNLFKHRVTAMVRRNFNFVGALSAGPTFRSLTGVNLYNNVNTELEPRREWPVNSTFAD